MLGDFGAEVVKIGDPRAPSGREGGINNKLNRNKQGLALRLDEAAGKQLFLDLVSVSDVVVENFRPRVMRNFGLTYDVLRGVRPDLIMCSMPGFGTEGEYAEYPAFGPSVETMTGITSLMGYPGGPPQTSAIAYPDAVAGMNSVGAIMTALWHRRRTGHGQFIDLALSEGPVCQIGEQIASPLVTAYSDPLLPGYGHYEYDHEGTPARKVVHIDRGVFSGFMNSRQTAALTGAEPNGHYRATDASLVPLIRMSNTCIAGGNASPEQIISEVEDGYYLVAMRVPSISESRENFRITARRAYEIRNGRIGQLYRDGGVTSDSKDFLSSVDAVGDDFRLSPIPNCGKGQPMQVKKLGNGAPTLRSRARVTGRG